MRESNWILHDQIYLQTQKVTMREIKFRAKRYNGEWISGDLHLYTPFPHIHSTLGDKAKIDTDTIGQFTGLHDKNGKEVYEGDVLVICEYENMLKGVVCEAGEHELFTLDELKGELQQQYKSVIHYEDCTLFASEQDGCDIYLASLAGDMRKSYPIFEYEVIGNIHDNPELLKTE